MKRSVAVLVVLTTLAAHPALAAEMNSNPLGLKQQPAVHVSKTNVAELRLGGGSVADYLGQSMGPLMTLVLERRVSEQMSLGVQVSRASTKTSYADGFGNEFGLKSSHTMITGRASYHLADLLDDERVDLYGGGTLGYNAYSASTFGLSLDSEVAKSSFVSVGGFTGGRFWFKPNLGVSAEVGYQYGLSSQIGLAGTAWGSGSVGLAFRF